MSSKIKNILFGVLLLVSGYAAGATYTYSGVSYTVASGAYTTSMKINGSFTTTAPLPPNLSMVEIGPGAAEPLVTSWSFSDGVNSYTNSNSMLLYGSASYFAVSTGVSGEITDFTIGFMSPPGTHTVGQPINGIYFSSIQQATSAEPCNVVTSNICTAISAGGANYAESTLGGTFSHSELSAIPTFSEWGMIFMASLMAMFGIRRMRRK